MNGKNNTKTREETVLITILRPTTKPKLTLDDSANVTSHSHRVFQHFFAQDKAGAYHKADAFSLSAQAAVGQRPHLTNYSHAPRPLLLFSSRPLFSSSSTLLSHIL